VANKNTHCIFKIKQLTISPWAIFKPFQWKVFFFYATLYYFQTFKKCIRLNHYLSIIAGMAVGVKKKKQKKSFSIILCNTHRSPVLIIQSIKPKCNLSFTCFHMQWINSEFRAEHFDCQNCLLYVNWKYRTGHWNVYEQLYLEKTNKYDALEQPQHFE